VVERQAQERADEANARRIAELNAEVELSKARFAELRSKGILAEKDTSPLGQLSPVGQENLRVTLQLAAKHRKEREAALAASLEPNRLDTVEKRHSGLKIIITSTMDRSVMKRIRPVLAKIRLLLG
jgi:hypothetical protein